MAVGWIMLIPFFVYAAGWQEFRSVSATGLMAVVFLGVGCSGLGYLFWYAALERLEASQVAAFLHLEPLVTLVVAVALLGEAVAVSTILGGVLVVVGVLTVQSANSQETPNPAFAAVGDRRKAEPPRGHERALNWP